MSSSSVKELRRFWSKNLMFRWYVLPWLFAEISTVSSTIWRNYSVLAGSLPRPTTCSWEITLTEVTIQLRPSPCSYAWRSDSEIDWLSSEVTMNPDKSLKCKLLLFYHHLNIQVRFLRWVFEKVWKCECVEDIHWTLRLLATDRCRRRLDLLPPWWSLPLNWHSRLNQTTRSRPRSASWRTYLRFAMVWPWWSLRLGYLSQRCWLFLRSRHLRAVQPCQWT